MRTGRAFTLVDWLLFVPIAVVLWMLVYVIFFATYESAAVLYTTVHQLPERSCVADLYSDNQQVWQCDDGCYYKGTARADVTRYLRCPEGETP
jgi:hypothetical protein